MPFTAFIEPAVGELKTDLPPSLPEKEYRQNSCCQGLPEGQPALAGIVLDSAGILGDRLRQQERGFIVGDTYAVSSSFATNNRNASEKCEV